MRNILVVFSLVLFGLAIAGCGGSKSMQSADAGDITDWYTTVPQDPNYLFAPATATSQDLQLAVDKATTAARTEIGRQVEVRINGLQKRFDEEVGIGKDAQLLQMFTQANKTVVSTSLSGSRTKQQTQSNDGGIWRAYVLVEYPIGAANQALMQQIKNNEQMYTRFRATQTFKELDEEVNKYEEWKKSQREEQK